MQNSHFLFRFQLDNCAIKEKAYVSWFSSHQCVGMSGWSALTEMYTVHGTKSYKFLSIITKEVLHLSLNILSLEISQLCAVFDQYFEQMKQWIWFEIPFEGT